MSVGGYVVRVIAFLAIVGPLAFAAVRWRKGLLPGWSGPPARLVEVVLGAAAAIVVAELLGSVGAFRRWPMVAACVAVGLGSWRVRGARRESPSIARADVDRASLALALAVPAVVVALWSSGALLALRAGPVDVDTQTYHLPNAARFVQDGSLTGLHFGTVDDVIPYHPANGEVVHAVGMLAFGRDVLSPFVNLGWVLFALLAAWCIGATRGMGAATVASVSLVFVTPLIVTTQGGSAMTDIVAVACFLASVAILLAAPGDRRALAAAGLAAGLALGAKLSLLVPIAALTVAVCIEMRRRKPNTAASLLTWTAPVVLTGGYWYLRNLVRVGNPIPGLHVGVGSFSLPRPPIGLVDRYGFSVADYAFDLGIWRRSFLPGLAEAFGPLWPLMVGLALAGLVLAVFISTEPLPRLLGLAGVLAAIAYVFTPTTAFGTAGRPVLFVANLRYLAPTLALGLALGPTLGSARPNARRWAAPVLALLVVVCALTFVGWRAFPRTALLLLFGGGAIVAAVWPLARRRAVAAVVAVVAVVTLAATVGFFVQRRYADQRFSSDAYAHTGWWDTNAFVWAQGVRDARIGIAGFFVQYPLFGPDLSNRVEYVGDLRPDGAFTDYRSCSSWRRAVNRGEYDYVVIMPPFPERADPPQVEWTASDPAAADVLRKGRSSVFRIRGHLDANECSSGS